MQTKRVHVFYDERFPLPTPSHYMEMIKKLENILHD